MNISYCDSTFGIKLAAGLSRQLPSFKGRQRVLVIEIDDCVDEVVRTNQKLKEVRFFSLGAQNAWQTRQNHVLKGWIDNIAYFSTAKCVRRSWVSVGKVSLLLMLPEHTHICAKGVESKQS